MQSPSQPDPLASRRAFRRAARKPFEDALSREAGRRLMERLALTNVEPARILDLGCGRGEDLRALRARYSRAQAIGLDFAWEVLRAAQRAVPFAERARSWFAHAGSAFLCADLSALPIRDASIGLVWSNLALSWVPDPLAAFREWARVLEPGGLAIFCAYGPDTLQELKRSFARRGAAPRVHEFIDMHDLGDLLVAAGFAAPVMYTDRITLAYAEVGTLLREIKASGQVNTARERGRGLQGRRAWQAMISAYENARAAGRIPASIELVFGHAWKASARPSQPARRKEWTPVRIEPRSAGSSSR
ncbi:MAG: methyltransferase domain-containing protein [Burkholderiales bacterium]|nr:methyltransferase domain-containing protein [Burkholderiales bacterium]